MKKLLVILMVLVTTALSAQDYYHVYTSQSASWNGYSWQYDNAKSNNLTITMKGSLLLINDQAHSTYYCYSYDGDNSWQALDEKQRRCLIIITHGEGYSCLCVMYNDWLIRYYYR